MFAENASWKNERNSRLQSWLINYQNFYALTYLTLSHQAELFDRPLSILFGGE